MVLTDRRLTGWRRRLFRAPILLYRARLGALLGRRVLYLAHRGRRTGRRRETVLEVVRYDPDVPEAFVVAAWGARSDWYRNLRVAPPIEVQIGLRHWPAPRFRFLEDDEVIGLLRVYRRAHRRAWRRLAPLMGFPRDPDDRDWHRVAARVRGVAFRPTATG